MADVPDTLLLKRHRDLEGRRHGSWARRVLIVAVGVLPLLALLNVFGQRPATSTAATAAARLQVYAPTSVRGGLMYVARFRIDALHDLKNVELILAPGWADQYTVNGITPQPIGEGSDNGRLVFRLGHVPKGRHYTLFVSLQVNPTNVGHHGQTVWLYDGQKQLAVLHREITIWP
jgi:hypothetical protein